MNLPWAVRAGRKFATATATRGPDTKYSGKKGKFAVLATTGAGVITVAASLPAYWEVKIRGPYLNEKQELKRKFDELALGGVDFYGRLDGFKTDLNIELCLRVGDKLRRYNSRYVL